MDFSTEDEDTPPPFLQRRSTWLFGLAGCVAIALGGWWWKTNSVSKSVADLGATGQYDAAWAKLKSSESWLGDCGRFGLSANLAKLDERTDSLLLRMADSLRACSLPGDSLLELVSLGNLRIAEHSRNLDSSAHWTLQATAFRAASECVKTDSGNKACRSYGFQALAGMKDSYGQIAWIKSALVRWPDDSSFLRMNKEALGANTQAKQPPAQPAKIDANKPKRK